MQDTHIFQNKIIPYSVTYTKQLVVSVVTHILYGVSIPIGDNVYFYHNVSNNPLGFIFTEWLELLFTSSL